MREGLRHVATLARELTELGWELTAPRRTRLLALLAMVSEEGDSAGACRFGILGGCCRSGVLTVLAF